MPSPCPAAAFGFCREGCVREQPTAQGILRCVHFLLLLDIQRILPDARPGARHQRYNLNGHKFKIPLSQEPQTWKEHTGEMLLGEPRAWREWLCGESVDGRVRESSLDQVEFKQM